MLPWILVAVATIGAIAFGMYSWWNTPYGGEVEPFDSETMAKRIWSADLGIIMDSDIPDILGNE